MTNFILFAIIGIILASFAVLDLTGRLRLTAGCPMSILAFLSSHVILMFSFLKGHPFVAMELLAFLLYFMIRLNLTPVKVKDPVGLTTRILYGGRRLLFCGIGLLAVNAVLWFFILGSHEANALFFDQVSTAASVADGVLSLLIAALLLANGALRVLIFSKRLRVVRRVIVLCMVWIPVVQLIPMLYLCRIARIEFDHECDRAERRSTRVDTRICATRYPFVLIHGVGFRDIKYVNYWGRIPKELKRNGAVIYYGNQEAWGSVENNAADLKKVILRAMEENGTDKVNILAHSKGGLDARYLITHLDMAEHVASLTTISTPHRGSPVADVLGRLPDRLYRRIASTIDKYFHYVGDTNPDSYTAGHQLMSSYCQAFNEKTPDSPLVYYQSYTSVMKNTFSDMILSIPHAIMKLAGREENDGLVSVSSSQWGEFRGVFRNRKRRGISHADIIDLRREDYGDFDVIETFVGIVSQIKEMGF